MASISRLGRKGTTAKGISFSALAGIASLAAGVLLLPVVLVTVGPSAYGVWLFLLAAASFLFFLDFGVGIAVIHFLSRSRSADKTVDPSAVASTAHAWATVACLLAISIQIVISMNYLENGHRSISSNEYQVLVVCCLALLATMSIRPMSSVLFGSGFLHIERINQLAGVAVRVLGTLAACFFGWGIIGVAIAETAALTLPTILSAAKAHRMNLVSVSWRHISKGDLKIMLSYSLKSFSVSIVGASILQFGTLIIGVLGSSDEVAFYNAAFRIYISVRQAIGWLTDPFRSVLSRLYVKDERAASKVLYDLLLVSFMTSAFGCSLLVVTLPVVLDIWLGETVPIAEVTATASALLVGLIFNSIHIPLVPASDAAGSPGAFLLHQVLWLAAFAGLSAAFFPLLGILGVALAMTVPLPLLELAYLFTARRTVKLTFTDWYSRVVRPVLPVLLLGLLAFGAVALRTDKLFVTATGIGFLVAAFSAVYLTRRKWSYRSVLGSLRIES